MKASTSRYVALLRGINVGGKNKLAMGGLAEVFAEAGCAHVSTYIQSGNVVFSAKPTVALHVASRVSEAVLSRFGLRVPVVVRSADELGAIVQKNPFAVRTDAPLDALHVVFLEHLPAQADVARLDANRSPGDRFEALGKEIYLLLPNGVARTKLTNAYFDATLRTVSTMRNWKTVRKLLQLGEAES